MTGFKQIARISELCEASIPDALASAMESLDGDERAEFELGVAYATQQCADLLRARGSGHPPLRAQPLAGVARDPRSPARAPGPGRSRETAAAGAT